MPKTSKRTYPTATPKASVLREQGVEDAFIEKMRSLKYTYRSDIRDRVSLERNFREKFEELNRVRLTDAEFARLLEEIITPDVFTAARAAFVNHFKEVQRLKTQLDQYTDLTEEDKGSIEEILPRENLLGFRGAYLETAQRLKAQQGTGADKGNTEAEQVDFEFVLFSSAVIDYHYIMGLIAKFSEKGPAKSKMTREELIGLISSDAKFMNERDDIAAYIATLKPGEGLSETAIRQGYTRFKAEKNAAELAAIAARHQLATAALQGFVDTILQRLVFDGEQLSDLMAPLDLGWKARTQAELALMADLVPLLTKRAQGRDISGLSAYQP